MRKAIVFEASRDGYGIDQVADKAMTVGELISFLQDFDEDRLVILSHDRGYTYGVISEDYAMDYQEKENGEWVEVDEYGNEWEVD